MSDGSDKSFVLNNTSTIREQMESDAEGFQAILCLDEDEQVISTSEEDKKIIRTGSSRNGSETSSIRSEKLIPLKIQREVSHPEQLSVKSAPIQSNYPGKSLLPINSIRRPIKPHELHYISPMAGNVPNSSAHHTSSPSSVISRPHSPKSTYNLELTLQRCRKNRQIHRLCNQHYTFVSNCIIIPAFLIGAVASIYSFAYDVEANECADLFIHRIVIGTLAAINTLLFTINSYLKLPAKSESHFIAAEEYDNLLTTIGFELQFPNEHTQEFANRIEKKILEIKKSCRYFPPDFIIKKYKKMNFRSYNQGDSFSI